MTKAFLILSLTLVAACSSGPTIIPDGGGSPVWYDRIGTNPTDLTPSPEPDRPKPEWPVSEKPDTDYSWPKAGGNASGNNGKGGNYPWTGHINNGKGKQ